MTCGYEAPTWAHYPDGRCIDGYLWDLDSVAGDGMLYNGGEIPCPACNTVEYIDCTAPRSSGNARQRRRVVRIAARKVRLWAMRRSTFPCNVNWRQA